MYIRRFGFLLVLVVFALAACVPVTQPEPDRLNLEPTPLVPLNTPASPEETPAIPATGDLYTYDRLVNDLAARGLEPTPAGTVRQPFFDVSARVLTVNGQDIQVFEFPDEQARQAAESTISATGDIIGVFQPTWVDIPNFWSQGNLLVLYIGQDLNVIQQMDQILGERITVQQTEDAVLPVTGTEAQRFLAEQLGIDISRVQILSFQAVQWPDACLGLAAEDELCAQVMTPGYQLMFQVDERQYEVRTDTSGSVIRLAQRIE
jgi:hypothetical protein